MFLNAFVNKSLDKDAEFFNSELENEKDLSESMEKEEEDEPEEYSGKESTSINDDNETLILYAKMCLSHLKRGW